MIARKRVLVVLDGTPDAERALLPGSAHAAAEDAQLHILQILSPAPLSALGGNRDAERAAWLYLYTIAQRLHDVHGDVTYEVCRGPALPVIRREAKRADAVFVATRGAVLLRRFLGRRLATAVLGWRLVIVVREAQRSAARKRPVRSFDDDAGRKGSLFQRPLGIRPVELGRIVGSVGRARELRRDFRPRSAGDRNQRYRELRRIMEEGTEVPPIELYKLGDRYYVLDGNHRVSIALALGWSQIDAVVTEFVPMHDAQAQQVAQERRTFERVYGLEFLEATRPGHYRRLESLIREHQARAGIADERQAAQNWYSGFYLPLERRMKAAGLRAVGPEEKPADLLIYLATLKESQEEFLGRTVSWDEALSIGQHRYQAGAKRHRRSFSRPVGWLAR